MDFWKSLQYSETVLATVQDLHWGKIFQHLYNRTKHLAIDVFLYQCLLSWWKWYVRWTACRAHRLGTVLISSWSSMFAVSDCGEGQALRFMIWSSDLDVYIYIKFVMLWHSSVRALLAVNECLYLLSSSLPSSHDSICLCNLMDKELKLRVGPST